LQSSILSIVIPLKKKNLREDCGEAAVPTAFTETKGVPS
jgi:hypothetical protein